VIIDSWKKVRLGGLIYLIVCVYVCVCMCVCMCVCIVGDTFKVNGCVE